MTESAPRNLWQIFTAAPHRVMFFGGTLQLVLTMLWWLLDLATRYGSGNPISWTIAPNTAHLYLMIYGIFPFFMFGFLMTTFPRWMGGKEIPARLFVPAFLLMLAGVTLFYAGLLIKALLLAAVASTLAGWAIGLYALLQVLRQTKNPDKRHSAIAWVAFTLGWCGAACYLVWLLTDNYGWLTAAMHAGIWLFLLPVFFNVGHRMMPFFIASAIQRIRLDRPDWPLTVILLSSAGHGLLQILGHAEWTLLCDLPLAATAFYLGYAWNLRRCLGVPMVAVLHLGIFWLGVAMLLYGVQSLTLLATGQLGLGLAPLHALTIGFFATVLLGMATRVSLGHSGLSINPQRTTLLLFLLLQVAVLLRVAADLLPAQLRGDLYIAAASVWLLCFAAWASFYLPLFLKPRADGFPG
ncbi:MAG TPA: NnrS family protein [Gallionellaceae bacterium]